jgi:hypothetical protein
MSVLKTQLFILQTAELGLISKDNGGKTIGWLETYFSKDESVDVSVHRNVSTITTRDRATGKVDSKTFIGRTPLLSDFDGKK